MVTDGKNKGLNDYHIHVLCKLWNMPRSFKEQLQKTNKHGITKVHGVQNCIFMSLQAT